MNPQNLQQQSFMLSTIKIMDIMVEVMKMIQPLNLNLMSFKSLNQIFVITQTHIFL